MIMALPPEAYFVRVRLGRSTQRLRGRRGVIQPDSKKLRDFARLPTALNRGFTLVKNKDFLRGRGPFVFASC